MLYTVFIIQQRNFMIVPEKIVIIINKFEEYKQLVLTNCYDKV